ncbi:MAG: type 3 dihydrofolate reductase [Thiohalophilus sp.]|jgi:dihydrofolate reductase
MASPSRPRISLIAAMTPERVIGIENRLPWHLPADMQWFRKHTLGKPVVMGRKTFESFGGKPLPKRTNIVITRDPDYVAEGALVAHSVNQALEMAGEVDEIMVIGGASFYEQILPHADRLYLTVVDADIKGDAWFPEFNREEWCEVERHHYSADDKNCYAHDYLILDRR